MIQFDKVSKSFDSDFLKPLSLDIPLGQTIGLIGSNGSGKSTLLRLLSGLYQPDAGRLTLDNVPLYENIPYKQQLFFAPDEPFFFARHNLTQMKGIYQMYYPAFDEALYHALLTTFGLNPNKAIGRFSKGQKRQVLMILALSCSPNFLLLDEIFDGLDLVMKESVKKTLADQMATRQMTTLITTHNISELDSLCDRILLMHDGQLLLDKHIDDLSASLFRVSLILPDNKVDLNIFPDLQVMKKSNTGHMLTFILQEDKQKIEAALTKLTPLYFEITPCSAHDVFLTTLSEVGYGTDL